MPELVKHYKNQMAPFDYVSFVASFTIGWVHVYERHQHPGFSKLIRNGKGKIPCNDTNLVFLSSLKWDLVDAIFDHRA